MYISSPPLLFASLAALLTRALYSTLLTAPLLHISVALPSSLTPLFSIALPLLPLLTGTAVPVTIMTHMQLFSFSLFEF
jgi:hypothetical protein